MNTQRATRHSPEPAVHIVVRPMRMGARGKWIKTGASWVDVTSGYDTGVRDIVPDHLAAVRAMATGNADLRWSRGERAQLLERFGPGLWRSLRMAVDAGVALITDRPGGTVTLADLPAEVQVDLRAADDGGITLGAGLTHEGRPIGSAPGTHHLIGRPPTGVVVVNGADIGLVPLARPVHDTIVPLLDGRTLHVPRADVDELVDVYQPRLAQVATIGSSDGSVTIEETEFAGVVATIRHDSVDAASLRWVARYRRGQRTTDHCAPVTARRRPGPGRRTRRGGRPRAADRAPGRPGRRRRAPRGPDGGRGGHRDPVRAGRAVAHRTRRRRRGLR